MRFNLFNDIRVQTKNSFKDYFKVVFDLRAREAFLVQDLPQIFNQMFLLDGELAVK